ncbi:MAG: alpha/beta hydrolase [Bacteroidales bacterium]|nr:alpha/beta hydrolase [Bacteroidales bacterium]
MIDVLFRKLSSIFFIIVSVTILISCEKEQDPLNTTYLQDYKWINSYSSDQVKTNLNLASLFYPEFDSLSSISEYGVDIYKITYKTHLLETELNASGLVIFPQSDEVFPLVSFQNGTNTCHYYAPSENANDRFYSLISMLSGSGYILTIPDYIGFGDSDNYLHPYMHRESSNDAIIDLLKAVKEFIEVKNIPSKHNGELYLMGYSQGGWATMSVLNELETFPVPGLEPKAVMCGAGAYNLIEMAKYIFALDEYPNPFFLPYFVESRSELGLISDDLDLYFLEPYASKIPDLFNGDKCNSEMNAEFTKVVPDLLTPQLISGFEDDEEFLPLREQLRQNSIPAWNSAAKIRMYHSTGDQTIPFSQSYDFYEKLLQARISKENIHLELVNNDTLDHGDAIIPWGIDAINYLQSLQP